MLENYQYKMEPFAHQLEALKRSWSKPDYALFWLRRTLFRGPRLQRRRPVVRWTRPLNQATA